MILWVSYLSLKVGESSCTQESKDMLTIRCLASEARCLWFLSWAVSALYCYAACFVRNKVVCSPGWPQVHCLPASACRCIPCYHGSPGPAAMHILHLHFNCDLPQYWRPGVWRKRVSVFYLTLQLVIKMWSKEHLRDKGRACDSGAESPLLCKNIWKPYQLISLLFDLGALLILLDQKGWRLFDFWLCSNVEKYSRNDREMRIKKETQRKAEKGPESRRWQLGAVMGESHVFTNGLHLDGGKAMTHHPSSLTSWRTI